MSKQPISTEALVVQVEGNIVTDMDGDKVMLNISKGKYYNLGKIGGAVWELIKTPQTLESIVNKLVEEYEVEKEVCSLEVQSFLEDLKQQGLVYFQNSDEMGI
ncbi:lasso peptide biosynthesis PqqD family chaperone [Alkalihalobacillus trypoxylicola]|uniref:Metallophosphoesterase n=1 Tax=Alkalihalobacillus trypoxylicola TaxID=519424 RepID=A0A161QFJ9_9BACI|nr:lasso peptide biosynthesis PqqD family chaperone [Alkalihalobacillus trypoxylicola]KYG27649.1 metallophosphoesterase [Alkalihalobacillus trypoxylicola]